MGEIKTTKNDGDVGAFIDSVENKRRREDCKTVVAMMKEITGDQPVMWAASIIGFGDYHYKYESGREGDWFKVGVSPRKQSLSLYIVPQLDAYEDLLSKLGKHKRGAGCLYINKLGDVDTGVLRDLIRESVKSLE